MPRRGDGRTRRWRSLAPGTWCCSHFSSYSTYLMPRKTRPKTMVKMSEDAPAVSASSAPAHQTPMAMAKPEVISIAVLAVPSGMLSVLTGRDEGRVVPVAIDQIGEEHAAEEHDFGEQEEPHAEGCRPRAAAPTVSKWWRMCGSDVRGRAPSGMRLGGAGCDCTIAYPTVVTSCLVLCASHS